METEGGPRVVWCGWPEGGVGRVGVERRGTGVREQGRSGTGKRWVGEAGPRAGRVGGVGVG